MNEAFGVIPKPTRVLPKEWTVEPTADGEREFFIRRKGEQQLVAVGYRIPSALADDYEATAMAASSSLVGLGITAQSPKTITPS